MPRQQIPVFYEGERIGSLVMTKALKETITLYDWYDIMVRPALTLGTEETFRHQAARAIRRAKRAKRIEHVAQMLIAMLKELEGGKRPGALGQILTNIQLLEYVMAGGNARTFMGTIRAPAILDSLPEGNA